MSTLAHPARQLVHQFFPPGVPTDAVKASFYAEMMDSAYAKLNRAKLHRDALIADLLAFRDREPHRWTMTAKDHSDPKLAVADIHVHINEETPDTWPLMFGDILTNLRAALDHAVFGHAAARQTLTASQERDLSYPILHDAGKWQNAQNKLSPFLDANVLIEIEKTQPYHMTPDPNWHGLAVLNNLVNLDKHRFVQTVDYVSDELAVKTSDLDVIETTVHAGARMTEGAVIASLVVRRAETTGVPELKRQTFHLENGFVEKMAIPKVGDDRALNQMADTLVDDVEKTLDKLKAAGC